MIRLPFSETSHKPEDMEAIPDMGIEARSSP